MDGNVSRSGHCSSPIANTTMTPFVIRGSLASCTASSCGKKPRQFCRRAGGGFYVLVLVRFTTRAELSIAAYTSGNYAETGEDKQRHMCPYD